jgi:ubiquinone/menaquinone biosynthesis C-methylase UbiE
MRDLVEGGYLRPGMTVLDFGCGWGEDIRYLERQQRRSGVVLGYDPHEKFGWNAFPATKLEVITMIYVLNVIPDAHERWLALTKAWDLVKPGGFLFIACRTPTDIRESVRRYKWRRHHDGYLTGRRTFQCGVSPFALRNMFDNPAFRDAVEFATLDGRPYSNLLIAKRRWA